MQATLWLPADWPLAGLLTAGTSITTSPLLRQGFTLAHHADLPPEQVEHHRRRLAEASALAGRQWLWLRQVHGNIVANNADYRRGMEADAIISRHPDDVAVVMTADCLPILLCHKNGGEVAAIHAGWPGLYQEIIQATIAQLQQPPQEFYAWIGPCAGPERYEVDQAFYERFIAKNPAFAEFFSANRSGHYLADLPGIARYQLQACGVPAAHVSGGNLCSISEPRFFSHRRDGTAAGRMASFIAPIKMPA